MCSTIYSGHVLQNRKRVLLSSMVDALAARLRSEMHISMQPQAINMGTCQFHIYRTFRFSSSLCGSLSDLLEMVSLR